jgi:hypothetical protein
MKKCKSGVICFETMTLIFLFILFCVIFYIFLKNTEQKHVRRDNTVDIVNSVQVTPNYSRRKDVLLNPYTPPLSDEGYFTQDVRQHPINVSTQIGAVDASYRQVGILTPHKSTSTEHSVRILPLMGRPLFVSRSKWQYYTMTDKQTSIKLPIMYKGKSGTNEYGCDELLGGEIVYVEGYNEAFKITKYDNDTIKYIPCI